MPSFFPEGDAPLATDPSNKSLQKINSLLQAIETNTGGASGGGLTDAQLRATPVPVDGSVSISNSSIPVTDNGGSLTIDGTVELGATSLSALENISVTFPSTQNVSVQNASLPVTGTFWQATQPVSASSLPLPSGAATSVNQATANTSLANIDADIGSTSDSSASTDTGAFSLISLFKRLLSKIPSLSVSSTRLLVDGSGVTQPVSGSVSVSNIAGLNIPTHDYRGLGYTSGNLTSITYKTGGASGTTVATLTLAYDGSGNLTSVTKT